MFDFCDADLAAFILHVLAMGVCVCVFVVRYVVENTSMQRQTAVTAYFSSKQLLLFAFAGEISLAFVARQ